MNHLDLFSGIGGFSLAAQRVWGEEHNVVAFVEQDKYCQKVLNKHWPNVPITENIEDFKYEQTPTIDLLTGGFPCQPFSVAGKRKGAEDDRFLWHQMLRIIQESKPSWIIGENVTGILNMELDNCIAELEREDYEVQTFIIPACAVDARHRRDRIWIVANTNNLRQCEQGFRKSEEHKTKYGNSRNSTDVSKREIADKYQVGRCEDVADTSRSKLQRSSKEKIYGQRTLSGQFGRSGENNGTIWPIEPNVGRVAHGISSRVHRLKALGNAIVPQVVMPIMQAIKELNNTH